MEIYITARDSRIDDSMKEYLKDKINKIEKYSHKIVDVHATLDFQRYLYIADLNVNTNLAKIHCEENEGDMFAAIDKVIDKLERQMQKIKEKVQNHHYKHGEPRLGSSLAEEGGLASGKGLSLPVDIVEEDFCLKPMVLNEAIANLDVLHDPFVVFIKPEINKLNVVCKSSEFLYELYERKDGNNIFIKNILSVNKSKSGDITVDFSENSEFEIDSITLNDAVEKIKRSGKEFVIFFDTNNSQFSMVYYRKDGTLGVIRPNF